MTNTFPNPLTKEREKKWRRKNVHINDSFFHYFNYVILLLSLATTLFFLISNKKALSMNPLNIFQWAPGWLRKHAKVEMSKKCQINKLQWESEYLINQFRNQPKDATKMSFTLLFWDIIRSPWNIVFLKPKNTKAKIMWFLRFLSIHFQANKFKAMFNRRFKVQWKITTWIQWFRKFVCGVCRKQQ